MERRRKISRLERFGNVAAGILVGAGVGPKRIHLLTVQGRMTGKPYTTPLTVVETAGQRWLVAPYGGVSWARNATASGTAKLRRGRVTEQVRLEPVDAHEGAPVLKAYLRIEPGTRRAFGVEPDASIEEFEAIATKHPVFRIWPIDSSVSAR
jgi:deazaflavin-dependent oxidoreductase (nitroreductase family)